jgi:4-nitrophenyl phosphatase
MQNQIKALILDIDGVIWRNKEPIGDLRSLFQRIVARRINYAFATNNSTKTISTYLHLLTGLGVPVTDQQLFTSGSVTANYLQHELKAGSEVFVIGMPGLKKTLINAGFTIGQQSPSAVVVGLDEQFTYGDIKIAVDLVRTGIPFIGTNPDVAIPTPAGLIPGTGSILAAIETASGISPIIIGKPKPTIFQNAIKALKVSPSETLVVGDRLSTDIAGGQSAGCRVGLVLSGVTNLVEAKKWRPTIDFIADDLTALIEEIHV